MIDKIVAHSKTVLNLAAKHSWMVGAKYTNLRDVKFLNKADFIDIDWKKYNFEKHLEAVKLYKPKYTVAKDIEHKSELKSVLWQAEILSKYSQNVIIVPKCLSFKNNLDNIIPINYMFGFSVPTRYGGTEIKTKYFKDRRVHLLGGRPEIQRKLAEELNVVSIDCNRFTLDAKFGDYFNGVRFVPYPPGGYLNCLENSIININNIWKDYGR